MLCAGLLGLNTRLSVSPTVILEAAALHLDVADEHSASALQAWTALAHTLSTAAKHLCDLQVSCMRSYRYYFELYTTFLAINLANRYCHMFFLVLVDFCHTMLAWFSSYKAGLYHSLAMDHVGIKSSKCHSPSTSALLCNLELSVSAGCLHMNEQLQQWLMHFCCIV